MKRAVPTHLMVLLTCLGLAAGGASAEPKPPTDGRGSGPVAATDTPPIGVQIVARATAPLAAPMSGQLVEFAAVDGDRVQEKALLARFNCAQQEAVQMRARAEVAKREDILATQKRLKALNSYSKAEFSQAENDVLVARAELAVAKTAVDNCEVKAPFSGRVAAVMARNFQFVQAGSPLLDLVDDRDLELELVVSSMLLSWLGIGADFRVHISEMQADYPAKVTRISGRVDAASQTIKVYGRITGEAPALLPGMSGFAQFTGAAR